MHVTPFIDKYQGKRLNSPNDLTFAPDGALWFTDPPYGLFDPSHPNKDIDKDPAKQLKFNGVFRYKDGKLAAVITDLSRPNGIDFTADGKTLYISNSENTPAIHRYNVAADGSLSGHKVFADLSKEKGDGVPDGLRVDSKGDVWATGPGGIRIFSPAGKLLGQIQLPEVAANITWGDDMKSAYIMGSTSVYRIRLLVAGKPALYSR
jgi:gluconolactonase